MNEKITTASVEQLINWQKNGEVSAELITKSFLDKIQQLNPELNAYITVCDGSNDFPSALDTAKKIDQMRVSGEKLPQMAGVPIGLKDMICTRGIETTGGSQILKTWVPPYNATLAQKIIDNCMPILGKHNLDEFAMGSTNEFSGFGPVKNPLDTSKVPGGSGGGSAASVASGMSILAVGTDTGGSIRQPSAFTGTVGFKPTYGAVSRFGVLEMSSSLDQPGPVARSVLDSAYLFDIIKGYDPKDSTSQPFFSSKDCSSTAQTVKQAQARISDQPLKGVRIGVIKELTGEGFETGVLDNFKQTVRLIEDLGGSVDEVAIPMQKYALSAYFLIMPAEVSSNLARFDGVRYGQRVERENMSVADMTRETRGKFFGNEAKRRILLGTHILSAGYYDAYYGNALKVRTLLQEELKEHFSKYDFLVSPTAPTVAFNLGEEITDPMTRYSADIATVTANLAGYPAISIPNGLSENLPTGFQILGSAFKDNEVYALAGVLEEVMKQQGVKQGGK